jgi:hypothetical protein
MKKVTEPTGSVLFEEKQAFPRWLRILIFSLLPFVTIVVLITGLYAGNERSELTFALIPMTVVSLVNIWMFYFVRFEKLLTRDGFYYRWKPFQKKYRVLERAEIDTSQFRKPPLRYGFGIYPGYGRVHNMSNTNGWQIQLVSGKRLFFGTAEPFLFERAIREFLGRNERNPQTSKPQL